jgi:Na+/H+-dicarboxylate symporter
MMNLIKRIWIVVVYIAIMTTLAVVISLLYANGVLPLHG